MQERKDVEDREDRVVIEVSPGIGCKPRAKEIEDVLCCQAVDGIEVGGTAGGEIGESTAGRADAMELAGRRARRNADERAGGGLAARPGLRTGVGRARAASGPDTGARTLKHECALPARWRATGAELGTRVGCASHARAPGGPVTTDDEEAVVVRGEGTCTRADAASPGLIAWIGRTTGVIAKVDVGAGA